MAKPKVPSTLVTGKTFPVKEELKALGAWWDNAAKGWWVPNTRLQEAQLLVSNAGGTAERVSNPAARSPTGWRPCGYPGCSSNYCDECNGRGMSASARW